MSTVTTTVPGAFIWRRIQSLMGLWLVLFLIEHLLTNSQAALWLGDNGQGFVKMVDRLHNFPYLQAIELFLIGVPLLIHGVWGVKYLFTAKSNSTPTDGSKPALHQYGRNHAYTWQRITSWILLIGIILHVAKFRFLEYPESLNQGVEQFYFVRVEMDRGLYTVADRLGVKLYDAAAIEKERMKLQNNKGGGALFEAAESIPEDDGAYDEQKALILGRVQKYEEKEARLRMLMSKPLKEDQVMAVASDFGTASLLTVRNTFKNPIYVGLYTIFVLAACFHAFNGLWTFLITWGVVLRMAAQKSAVTVTTVVMVIIAFLGLAAVWGTYWFNLKH